MGLPISLDDRDVIEEIIKCIFNIRNATPKVPPGRSFFVVINDDPDVLDNLAMISLWVRDLSRKAKALAPHTPWRRIADLWEPLTNTDTMAQLESSWGEVCSFLDNLLVSAECIYDRMGRRWHPWRLCPGARIWTAPDSESGPISQCRWDVRERSRKDYLYPSEVHAIAEARFGRLKGAPAARNLGFSKGNEFDYLIRGWTQYWNEVLFLAAPDGLPDPIPVADRRYHPTTPLDADLVKALIATESGFRPEPPEQNAGGAGKARGLIQITEEAHRALSHVSDELKNHYVMVSWNDLLDPALSICAGIRWLFRKQRLASGKLGHSADWFETIIVYKGYLRDVRAGRQPRALIDLRNWYDELKTK